MLILCPVDYSISDGADKKYLIKGNIKRHVGFWEKELEANRFVLDTIKSGYLLPFKKMPYKYQAKRNNSSSLGNKEFVTEAVNELLKFNFIKEEEKPPFCVNPLTVASNAEKLRLVLDLGFVNDFLEIPKFKYEDLRTAVGFLEQDFYFSKFDIKSGYHHI